MDIIKLEEDYGRPSEFALTLSDLNSVNKNSFAGIFWYASNTPFDNAIKPSSVCSNSSKESAVGLLRSSSVSQLVNKAMKEKQTIIFLYIFFIIN